MFYHFSLIQCASNLLPLLSTKVFFIKHNLQLNIFHLSFLPDNILELDITTL